MSAANAHSAHSLSARPDQRDSGLEPQPRIAARDGAYSAHMRELVDAVWYDRPRLSISPPTHSNLTCNNAAQPRSLLRHRHLQHAGIRFVDSR